jgi:uncharacterized protein YprB with RNaseH-like and TPR domain
LPDGEVLATPLGPAYRIDSIYPRDYRHGPAPLDQLLGYNPALLAEVAQRSELNHARPEDLLFLDTETTGLAGGAGTLVFLIGIGRFEGANFRLRQYFLRDPVEEPGMLQALEADLQAAGGLITFNGAVFDLPLLDMRSIIGLRRAWGLSQRPQFDLLPPSRRLWRHQLPNCRLGTIEAQVLGVRRTEADVPGELIPGMYLDYLRHGETEGMRRVLYHNAIDILSLVGLTHEILLRHQNGDTHGLSPSEALGLAGWHEAAGRPQKAEAALRAAAAEGQTEVRLQALRRYGQQLKRTERLEQAAETWGRWHELAPDDPRPCVELSKYFEWQAKDLEQARMWGEMALVALTYWPDDWRRKQAWQAVEHRLTRLDRKLGGKASRAAGRGAGPSA